MNNHTQPLQRTAACTLAAAAAALLLAGSALAQPNPKEELRRQVGAQLERLLPNGAGDVVNRLQNVKPTGAISRGFNLGRVSQEVFGRTAPNAAPDCRAATPSAPRRATLSRGWRWIMAPA